jgi:hypothetical protein
VLTETTEHFGGTFDAWRKDEWRGQFVEIALCGFDVSQGAQPFQWIAVRRWREDRYGAPPICHLDRFALLDAAQEFARPLAEFPDPNGYHRLLIAHDPAE